MCDVATLKQKLQQQYDNLDFKPEVALPDWGLNSFTKKYIKNILARVTGFIEESTGVASNYCNYMNTQTKNPLKSSISSPITMSGLLMSIQIRRISGVGEIVLVRYCCCIRASMPA